MLGGFQLLLLLSAIIVLIPLSDPRGNGGRQDRQTTQCLQKVAECGAFEAPKDDGGREVRCQFIRKKCHFKCTYKCKKTSVKGVGARLSKRRHKDLFTCKDKEWTRKNPDIPEVYCQVNLPVKEVTQSPISKADEGEMEELIGKLNDLINRLLHASYEYLTMSSVFARADVALPGFSKFTLDMSDAAMKHARELIRYFQWRGWDFEPYSIHRPNSREELFVQERKGQAGLIAVLNETQSVNEQTSEVIEQAKVLGDPHMKHFLEDDLLDYNVHIIKKIADLILRLTTFKEEEDYFIGVYSMDLELMDSSS